MLRTEANIAWVDGLRGISALGVLASHLSTAFSQSSFVACCAPGTSSPLWRQLPPLRLLAVGHAWLIMFLILSGYIQGHRALTVLKTRGLSEAYRYLAISTFKRPLRLALPASFATFIAWACAQSGGFKPAVKASNLLISLHVQGPSPTWLGAFGDLFYSLRNTWRWLGPDNRYDGMQWALVYMLQGSFLCTVVLLATLHLRTGVRLLLISCIWYMGWYWSLKLVDPLVTPSYMTGLLLAHSKSSSRLSSIILVLAVILMCFPKNNAELVLWSRKIQEWYVNLMPKALNVERGVSLVGCTLFFGAVQESPDLRRAFGSVRWLGRISFGLYLMHMTVLRLILPWLAFFEDPIDVIRSGDIQNATIVNVKSISYTRLAFALSITIGILGVLGELWARTVDPTCERIIKYLAEITRSQESEKVKAI